MDKEAFANAFAEHTHFRRNAHHPLVWINGDPEIGANVYIGGMSEVNAKGARVVIGDHCDISSFVAINCADSHRVCLGLATEVERRDVVIEHNVFVGSHSVIKGGARIGHHSVIAAGTVVDAGEVPPYSLVSGNPMSVRAGYYEPGPSKAARPIPHNRPSLGIEEERAAAAVIRSGFVSHDRQVAALEAEFCGFLGIEDGRAIAVSSGTAALYLALRLLEAEGREVAIPAYTCTAVLNAVRLARGLPRFMDNEPGSPNADPLAQAASHAPLAVIPHTYGIPASLATPDGTAIIEDCAHALGARRGTAFVGRAGVAAVFSFYATKLMTSGGEGGMIVARDRGLADAIRDFREFDQRRDRDPRFNFHMTDLQAAIGREQLRKLPGFLARREEIFDAYRSAGLDLLDTTVSADRPVRYRAVLRTDRPLKIIAALEEAGIRAIVPLEDWELLGDGTAYPNALALSRSTVSLPIYPTLEDRSREAVIATLASL